jgi:O-antigen/teichoic acid export membrane protein
MFYENMRNKNHAIVSDIMTYYLMLASTGIAIFILFAKEGFHFLIDERFNSGIGLSMIISNGLFFLLLTSMTDAYLGYYKLFTKNSLIMTVSAVFNIAINILFLREYGIIVAALSTLFSYFLFFMLAFFQVKEYARSHLQKRSFMFVAVVILSSNAVGFMTLYMGFWFTVILKISLIILLILLLSRSKMLRDDEKKYFHKTINKATRMIKMNTKQRNG